MDLYQVCMHVGVLENYLFHSHHNAQCSDLFILLLSLKAQCQDFYSLPQVPLSRVAVYSPCENSSCGIPLTLVTIGLSMGIGLHQSPEVFLQQWKKSLRAHKTHRPTVMGTFLWKAGRAGQKKMAKKDPNQGSGIILTLFQSL